MVFYESTLNPKAAVEWLVVVVLLLRPFVQKDV